MSLAFTNLAATNQDVINPQPAYPSPSDGTSYVARMEKNARAINAAIVAILAGFLPLDGTATMAGDLKMGGFEVKNALSITTTGSANLATASSYGYSYFDDTGFYIGNGAITFDGTYMHIKPTLFTQSDSVFQNCSVPDGLGGSSFSADSSSVQISVDMQISGAHNFTINNGAIVLATPSSIYGTPAGYTLLDAYGTHRLGGSGLLSRGGDIIVGYDGLMHILHDTGIQNEYGHIIADSFGNIYMFPDDGGGGIYFVSNLVIDISNQMIQDNTGKYALDWLLRRGFAADGTTICFDYSSVSNFILFPNGAVSTQITSGGSVFMGSSLFMYDTVNTASGFINHNDSSFTFKTYSNDPALVSCLAVRLADASGIAVPVEGTISYDFTLHKAVVYTGSAWEVITSV